MKDKLYSIAIFVLIVLSFYLIGCSWKEALDQPNPTLCPLCNK